jgi:hypothetical protein
LLSKLRTRLTFANVVSVVALFVALGGSSYAAIKVTGRNVKDSSLTGRDVRNSSLTTADVKNGALLSRDFRAGQLPAGPPGPQGAIGETGPPGPKGDEGEPATRMFAVVDVINDTGATLIVASGITAVERIAEGQTRLTFVRDVLQSECAVTATVGEATQGAIFGYAVVVPRHTGANANQVDVFGLLPAGTPSDEVDYHVAAFC